MSTERAVVDGQQISILIDGPHLPLRTRCIEPHQPIDANFIHTGLGIFDNPRVVIKPWQWFCPPEHVFAAGLIARLPSKR